MWGEGFWACWHTNEILPLLFAFTSVIHSECSFCITPALALFLAEFHLQQSSLSPNFAAAQRRVLHDYATWAATNALPPAGGTLPFTQPWLVLAVNVLNMRYTSQTTELLTVLSSLLPKGGVVFWPCVLGPKCEPVWSCWLYHSKSGWTLPFLEPL